MATVTYGLQRTLALAWAIIALVVGFSVYWSIFDTQPPFELQAYTAAPTRQGEVMVIDAKVKRDPERQCRVSWSRYMIDASLTRIELSGIQYSTAAAIEAMERASPGRLRLAIEIPESVSPGFARIYSTLEYVCNPVQRLYPIDVLTEMQVEILPKDSK